MTSEWGDYTPSTKNGTWTSMCSISAQARAIAYAADNANYAMAEGVWAGSWPALPEYGAPGLNKPDFTNNAYFEANAVWFGDNDGGADKEFLDTYYQTGLTETAAGTDDKVARGHILKTTSQDWLSVTYIMKQLDDAAAGIAAGGDAGVTAAQNAYDEVAATFLGCGNKNPVALPTFPNVTWGNTYATKGPTYYTVAGTMQEMSYSYDQQNSTSQASSAAEAVVAELVKNPSSAGIDSIKDAIFTVYTQSTLRYAANMTLDAHLPGNGMGGSTKPLAGSDVVTACGVNQLSLTDADCEAVFDGDSCQEAGAEAFTLAGSPEGSLNFDFPLCCNIASNAPGDYALPTDPDDVLPAGTGWVDTNWIRAGLYPSREDAQGNLNAFFANSRTTFPDVRLGGFGWGGLSDPNVTSGVIVQPQSGCTNTRANAMGVGNSLASTVPTESTNPPWDSEKLQMDNVNSRLLPYYLGSLGDPIGLVACSKMQAVSGANTDNEGDAGVSIVLASEVVPITGGCGTGMSDLASNHCTDGGNKTTGADTGGFTTNADRVNPRTASVLGGQAIFHIIAAAFAGTADSADVDPDSNVNINCVRNLDAMFTYNTGAIIRNLDGTTFEPATEADEIKGDMPGAVSFPTWYVAIGTASSGLSSPGFVVPNGFCYAKACLTEFLKQGTSDKGANMGELVKDPNMANPVTASSKCGLAQSACGDIAGYASVTGRTGDPTIPGDSPTKWDGKEWPVPEQLYLPADTVDPVNDPAVADGTALMPTQDGTGGYSPIPSFRGPVF